jgi:CRISPR-associated protein Cas2
MYLFVMFDLPVGTKAERRAASQFRNFLKKDGYDMLQFSVYTRICRGQDAVEKHIKRLQRMVPAQGGVRALQITDKQYARMAILVGKRKKHEKAGSKQLVLL